MYYLYSIDIKNEYSTFLLDYFYKRQIACIQIKPKNYTEMFYYMNVITFDRTCPYNLSSIKPIIKARLKQQNKFTSGTSNTWDINVVRYAIIRSFYITIIKRVKCDSLLSIHEINHKENNNYKYAGNSDSN